MYSVEWDKFVGTSLVECCCQVCRGKQGPNADSAYVLSRHQLCKRTALLALGQRVRLFLASKLLFVKLPDTVS